MAMLRRVVIKEELVALTGDYKKAIVLNQMMYWSNRVQDVAQMMEEEEKRLTYVDCQCELSHGWIYKKAEELSTETMMDIRPKAMREHLKYLVAKGWLFERRNPQDKMDRTLQYRVNLIQIQEDLRKKGYRLEGQSFLNTNSPEDQKELGRSLANPPAFRNNHLQSVKRIVQRAIKKTRCLLKPLVSVMFRCPPRVQRLLQRL